jgi:hypothetical protein
MSISDDQTLALLTDIKQGLGRVEGTLTATIKAHEERFDSIEETMRSNDLKQWVISACVIPVVSGLHYLANKIGIKV